MSIVTYTASSVSCAFQLFVLVRVHCYMFDSSMLWGVFLLVNFVDCIVNCEVNYPGGSDARGADSC